MQKYKMQFTLQKKNHPQLEIRKVKIAQLVLLGFASNLLKVLSADRQST